MFDDLTAFNTTIRFTLLQTPNKNITQSQNPNGLEITKAWARFLITVLSAFQVIRALYG